MIVFCLVGGGKVEDLPPPASLLAPSSCDPFPFEDMEGGGVSSKAGPALALEEVLGNESVEVAEL